MLGRLFKREKATSPRTSWGGRNGQRDSGSADSGKRSMWQAAKTDRVNSLHWADAIGTLINSALSGEMVDLYNRCDLESRRNSFVEGVIRTHTADIVGDIGPSLQATIDTVADGERGKRFVQRLERKWMDFWAEPEVSGRMCGVDLLRLWVRNMWLRGERLTQIARFDGEIKLQAIEPRRCYTPFDAATDPDVSLGIKRSREGRHLKYWISDKSDGPFAHMLPGSGAWYDADDILHGFETIEAGQCRGVPWLAPCLPMCAEMRDYDQSVLDAADNAAQFGVVLSTDHPEADYVEFDGTLEMQRREMTTAPPGWRPTMVNPQQPSTLYVDYRRERLRELGRVVSMPVLLVLLDAGNHNMSSANFDAQVYHRANRCIQRSFERLELRALINILIDEISLTEFGGWSPETLKIAWGWPRGLHPDPEKNAKARKVNRELGHLDFSTCCIEDGYDPEEIVKGHQKSDELWRAAGMEPPPHYMDNANSTNQQAGDPPVKNEATPSRAAAFFAARNGDGHA